MNRFNSSNSFFDDNIDNNHFGNNSTFLSPTSRLIIEQSKELTKAKQRISDLTNKINEFEYSYGQFAEEQNKLRSELRELSISLEESKKNIRQVQNKTLEPLAVFVGMFTFVSVGFNIFSNISDQALWLSLLFILGGFIILFASLVIHAGSLDSSDKGRRRWTFGLIMVGLALTVGGAVFWLNQPKDTNGEKTTIEKLLYKKEEERKTTTSSDEPELNARQEQ